MAKNYNKIFFGSIVASVGLYILFIIAGLLFNIEWFFSPLFGIAGLIVLQLFVFFTMVQD